MLKHGTHDVGAQHQSSDGAFSSQFAQSAGTVAENCT